MVTQERFTSRTSSNNFKKERQPPTQFEVFTGGKVEHPEFTIFYNIAFFRTAGVLHHLLNNKYEGDKERILEKGFTDWLKKMDAPNELTQPEND